MGTSTGEMRGLLRSGAGIAVATGIMNVSTYGFVVLAARMLGPAEYSAVASLMGLLLVVNVVSLGLQATAARQVAAHPERRHEIAVDTMATTYRTALALGALCLVLTPVIAWGLSLDSWYAAAMIGLSAIPLTVMGGQAGLLQGEHRWRPLAAIYLALGLGRLVVGVGCMLLIGSSFGAMLGVAIGAWLPALAGAVSLGRLVVPRPPRHRTRRGRSFLSEGATNSHALLAFFALSNLDVVLARALFDAHEAGLYAGGLILSKAVLFLPQFVVVVAFPSMVSSANQHRMYLKALLVVSVLGVLATVGAGLLSGLAVAFVGGTAYTEIRPYIWLFAALGTLLAMIQLMVYEIVARQHRAPVLVLWVGLAAVAVAAGSVDTGLALLQGVSAVYAGVLGMLLLIAALHRRSPGQDRRPDAQRTA